MATSTTNSVAQTSKEVSAPDILNVQRLCEPITDPATGGHYWIGKSTIGGYLELMGVYNPTGRRLEWRKEISVPGLQRALIRPDKNPVKQAMYRDVLIGATLPPLVLYWKPEDDDLPPVWVLDGSQRTHVYFLAALTAAQGKSVTQFSEFGWMTAQILKMKKPMLTFDELMNQPVFLQIWADFANPSDVVRIFLLLNAGQQKVSSKHLLDVLARELRKMFEEWGIPLVTEREEREAPRSRRGGEGTPKFRYSFLVTGLVAYLTGRRDYKTDMIISERTDAGAFDIGLEDKISTAGSDICKADFTWACLNLNHEIARLYDNERATNLIWSTETFFVPLMAAIGKAREREYPVEDRQRELIEHLKKSKASDPLVFGHSVDDDEEESGRKADPKALFTILDGLTSNIGKNTRDVVYKAFLEFFRKGIEPKYPIDWEVGKD